MEYGVILKKMDKLIYFSNVLTDFYEILHADAHWPPEPLGMFKKSTLINPRWRTAAILKNVKCDISAAVRPILMQFGMMMHLNPLKQTGNQKFSKSKMADGGHLENEKLRYLQNRLADLLKFCTITRISSQEQPAAQKY